MPPPTTTTSAAGFFSNAKNDIDTDGEYTFIPDSGLISEVDAKEWYLLRPTDLRGLPFVSRHQSTLDGAAYRLYDEVPRLCARCNPITPSVSPTAAALHTTESSQGLRADRVGQRRGSRCRTNQTQSSAPSQPRRCASIGSSHQSHSMATYNTCKRSISISICLYLYLSCLVVLLNRGQEARGIQEQAPRSTSADGTRCPPLSHSLLDIYASTCYPSQQTHQSNIHSVLMSIAIRRPHGAGR